MTESLFDADDYTSPQDSGREPRVPRGGRSRWMSQLVKLGEAKPSDGSWFVLSTTEGPMDGCHRVGPIDQLGTVITKCDKAGRVVYHPEVGTDVLMCPRCESDD